MSKGRLPYFKFDVTSWLTGDIRLLTAEEQGVFINLCALIWRDKGSYEITKLTHRHMNMSQQVFNACLQTLTDVEIVLNDNGVLSVEFISEQLCEREEQSEKNSIAGKISAKKRKSIQRASTKEERRGEERREEKKRIDDKPSYKTLSEDGFKDEVFKFSNEYSTEMLEAFYRYWSEPNSKGKMKVQLQKTWETSRRLITWSNNDFNKTDNKEVFTPYLPNGANL